MGSAKNAETFAAILSTFSVGMLRLTESELASLRLSVAVASHHTVDRAETDLDRESLRQLQAIRPTSWDAFNYVSRLSHLVYATSLLDTFLTDTTQFLLMLNPASIGKDFKISIADVLEKGSRSEVLVYAAQRKAREVSYKTFLQRLDYLRERFGLEFDLSGGDVGELGHFSGLRNVAVHDQGFIRLFLDDEGEVDFDQRSCSLHPTVVSIDDLRSAYRAYRKVAFAVGTAVHRQVLKSVSHQMISLELDVLSKHSDSSADTSKGTRHDGEGDPSDGDA